ncbi:hypothetical protein GCM10022288_18140 [Gryllotalpicola kribbensis]|uniref:DUF2530 domain-containing protein n=1 Tax=Gryllotalpicola kribbensis TaxID=993084 RepID=A0ABP8ASZ6_9MICO
MSEDDDRQPLIRAMFGRPRLWRGVLMTCLGAVWLALAIAEGLTTLRIVLGIVWSLLGVGYLVVGAYDRVHRSGAYARP